MGADYGDNRSITYAYDANGNLLSRRVEAPVTQAITPGAGGTLTYTDAQGNETTVSVPPGAVTQPISLTYTSVQRVSSPETFEITSPFASDPPLLPCQAFPCPRNVVFFKLDPAGNGSADLLYSTYLGGTAKINERGGGIAVDEAGMVYLTGSTWAEDFPTTTGAFDTTHDGSYGDGFVSKLNPSVNGAADLLYSTFLGGSYIDNGGYAIAVDETGDIYVVGDTYSDDFPVTLAAYQRKRKDYTDVTVTRLRPQGAGEADLIYSTYLGGDYLDYGRGIAVGQGESVYLTAITDPLGNTATFTRDEMSRITAATDPLGRTTAYDYDERGLLTAVTLPDGDTTTYDYDDLGLLSAIHDLNGNVWAFGYTAIGRLQSLNRSPEQHSGLHVQSARLAEADSLPYRRDPVPHLRCSRQPCPAAILGRPRSEL